MAGSSWPRRKVAGGVLAVLIDCRRIGCLLECSKCCDVGGSVLSRLEVGSRAFTLPTVECSPQYRPRRCSSRAAYLEMVHVCRWAVTRRGWVT